MEFKNDNKDRLNYQCYKILSPEFVTRVATTVRRRRDNFSKNRITSASKKSHV